VRLHLRQPGRTTVVEVDPRLRVSQTSAFFSQVKAIVGVGGVLTQR
jgi:DNA polymerase-3 subunit alpha